MVIDGVGKIKYRKELRSRYAKFVYYNHNRVVCECHMSRRRDHEHSGIPVKKLKCLSQKSRKLRVFVWKRILKATPMSSKLHGYIGWRLRSQIKRRLIIKGLRFVYYKKKEKARFYSTKIPSNNTFDSLWKIHWNTKTCKSEEISSVVHVLWTNEFN